MKKLTILIVACVVGCISSFGKSPSYIYGIIDGMNETFHTIYVHSYDSNEKSNDIVARVNCNDLSYIESKMTSVVRKKYGGIAFGETTGELCSTLTGECIACLDISYRVKVSRIDVCIHYNNGYSWVEFTEYPNYYRSKVSKGKSKSTKRK